MPPTQQPIHLEPLTYDDRDFSHNTLIGTLAAPAIPTSDFDLAEDNPIVLNQKNTDFCTAFASTEAYTVFKYTDPSLVNYLNSVNRPSDVGYRGSLAERFKLCTAAEYLKLSSVGKNASINSDILSIMKLMAGDYFDPIFQFSKIKQIRNEWQSYGANIREAMLSFTKYGSLLKKYSPFTYDEGKPTDRTRDIVSNWNNWDKSLDALAAKNKAPAFFTADGPNQPFDNIRSILWQNKQKGIKSGVVLGMYWKGTWGSAIIPDDGQEASYNATGAHCTWVRGQKTIGGQIYLVVQNSYGAGAGDDGLFYFPREVINRNFPIFGAYYFYPISVGDAQYHNENGIKLSANWVSKVVTSLEQFFIGLLNRNG